MKPNEDHHIYLIFILTLSILAILLLGVEAAVELEPGTKSILLHLDTLLCAIFFVDFFVSLRRAHDRKKYLLQWGWMDLLSCVPVIEPLRLGRAARVVRILRVLRGIRATKIITEFVLRRRAQGAFLAATLATILILTISSIAVLHFERVPEANIKTPEDAIWWSIFTITTVGYGDYFPVTTEGRTIASLLMIAGVGLFGTFSGFVASWFLKSGESQGTSEVKQLTEEITKLRELMEKRIGP
jgi:voltage-gated potassium channel